MSTSVCQSLHFIAMRLYQQLESMCEDNVMQDLTRDRFDEFIMDPSSVAASGLRVYDKRPASRRIPMEIDDHHYGDKVTVHPITDAEAVQTWTLEHDNRFLLFYDGIRTRCEDTGIPCFLGTYAQFMSFVYSVTTVVIQ